MAFQVEIQNNAHTQFARAQAFMPKSVLGFLVILKFVYEEFLVWTTRYVEVFLHVRFGVRGHSLFQTLQMCVVGTCVGIVLAGQDRFFFFFMLASAALAIYHRVEAVGWEKRGSPHRYTWSNGEPIAAWEWLGRVLESFGFKPWGYLTVPLIVRFYEPGLVLVIGLLLGGVCPILGSYLFLCSIALFSRAMIVHHRLVNMERDQKDSRLLAQWLASVQRASAGQADEQVFVVHIADAPAPKLVMESGATPATPAQQQAGPETAITTDDGYVNLKCQKCGKVIRVPRRYHGKTGSCKKCGNVMVVRTQLH